MMEYERRTIEDERMSMQEERQTMIKEREDIERLRENAVSGIDDSVRTLRRTARELAEGGTRGLGDRSSSSSPEGRPYKRLRRTRGGSRMPSETPAGPINARNGTDPPGLSTASNEVKCVWTDRVSRELGHGVLEHATPRAQQGDQQEEPSEHSARWITGPVIYSTNLFSMHSVENEIGPR